MSLNETFIKATTAKYEAQLEHTLGNLVAMAAQDLARIARASTEDTLWNRMTTRTHGVYDRKNATLSYYIPSKQIREASIRDLFFAAGERAMKDHPALVALHEYCAGNDVNLCVRHGMGQNNVFAEFISGKLQKHVQAYVHIYLHQPYAASPDPLANIATTAATPPAQEPADSSPTSITAPRLPFQRP